MKFFVFSGLLLSVWFVSSCADAASKAPKSGTTHYYSLGGEAQGTTYSITYKDTLGRDFSSAIDSLLKDYDKHLSTYIDSSLITVFNRLAPQNPTGSLASYDYVFSTCNSEQSNVFKECIAVSKSIYAETEGAFNPAIFPLVRYWGFFKNDTTEKHLSQASIDSIIAFSKFDDASVYFETDSVFKDGILVGCYPKLMKKDGRIQLDFNGIAQGHSVDVVAHFLKSKGITHFMVEIGGEVCTSGVNQNGSLWRIGIDKPVEGSSPGSEGFQFIVSLDNKAVATSGNYRKFYEKDGQKYAHTIDPVSGHPVTHSLISVTVIAETSALADGYATAFMVMGVDKAMSFIDSHPTLNLHAYFISDENGTWKETQSKDFESFIAK